MGAPRCTVMYSGTYTCEAARGPVNASAARVLLLSSARLRVTGGAVSSSSLSLSSSSPAAARTGIARGRASSRASGRAAKSAVDGSASGKFAAGAGSGRRPPAGTAGTRASPVSAASPPGLRPGSAPCRDPGGWSSSCGLWAKRPGCSLFSGSPGSPMVSSGVLVMLFPPSQGIISTVCSDCCPAKT